MTKRSSEKMFTRPIPQVAIKEAKKAFDDVRFVRGLKEGTTTSTSDTGESLERILDEARNRGQRPRWQLAQDIVARTAFTVLMGCTSYSSVPSAWSCGEYLVVLDDLGVTRPLVNIGDVHGQDESRGAASLRPMYLSSAEADVLSQALASRCARPTIEVALLPEYGD